MDTWENENNDVSAGISQLNVNAPVFVPGQNIFAAEFVPGNLFSKNSYFNFIFSYCSVIY